MYVLETGRHSLLHYLKVKRKVYSNRKTLKMMQRFVKLYSRTRYAKEETLTELFEDEFWDVCEMSIKCVSVVYQMCMRCM